MKTSPRGSASSLFLTLNLLAGAAAAPFRKFVHELEVQLLHDALTAPSAPVITGLYGNDSTQAQVVIHDTAGVSLWSWSSTDAQNQNIPSDLLSCIQESAAVPEAKWANGGNSVISIYNSAALMINHLPGSPDDKKVTFGVCLNWDNMGNTHSLELVPDGKIAIATTSDSLEGNIKIFPLSAGLQANGNAVQQLSQLPAVHGLVWDNSQSLLWAVGSDNAPDGEQPSSPALRAFKYNSGAFDQQPVFKLNITAPTLLSTEWTDTEYGGWWDGGHDIIPVPNKRQLLMSTDLDLHLFDIDTQTFTSGSEVADKFLPGFTPVGERTGVNGLNLPRSDIKSLSLDSNQNALYVQAAWQDVVSTQINRIGNQRIQPDVKYSQPLYRSRWFEDTAGWPKVNSV